jgi:hypothetical protein
MQGPKGKRQCPSHSEACGLGDRLLPLGLAQLIFGARATTFTVTDKRLNGKGWIFVIALTIIAIALVEKWESSVRDLGYRLG